MKDERDGNNQIYVLEDNIPRHYLSIKGWLKIAKIKGKFKFYRKNYIENCWNLINLFLYKMELLGKYIKILNNETGENKLEEQIENLKELIIIEGK